MPEPETWLHLDNLTERVTTRPCGDGFVATVAQHEPDPDPEKPPPMTLRLCNPAPTAVEAHALGVAFLACRDDGKYLAVADTLVVGLFVLEDVSKLPPELVSMQP